MAAKRVLTARVTVNMILADDVYTAENQLLVPSGTVVDKEIIAALKDRSIFAVRVLVEEDGKTPVLGEVEEEDAKQSADTVASSNIAQHGEDSILDIDLPSMSSLQSEFSSEQNYYEAVRESQEFKKFNENFLNTVDSLKDTFNRAVMHNEEIDSVKMLGELQEVISSARNGLHILDMLQCMKGYDDVTYVHSVNVALFSNMIGKIVFPNMSEKDLELLTLAGLLHDIGKMMVPDDVLLKKDHLTISEFNIAKTHVLHGSNILKGIHADPQIVEVAMRHHERCDGSGYPGGYTSNQISAFAKIVAIADTFDAMTSDRCYRKAICPFEVIHMFEREGITKYEVSYLLPFLSFVVQAYLNTEVTLTTKEVGKVVMINTEDLSKPVVKVGEVYYDLVKENTISIDRIID